MALTDHYTAAGFVADFPEFATIDSAILEREISKAAARTPADVWGNQTQERHGLRVAHALAMSPFGQDARVANKDGTTVYSTRGAEMDAGMGPAAAPRTT